MIRLSRQDAPWYDNSRSRFMLRMRRGNVLPSPMSLKKMTRMRFKRMTLMRRKKYILNMLSREAMKYSSMHQLQDSDEDDLVSI